jgi:predicted MFS family arabinose efflux permease
LKLWIGQTISGIGSRITREGLPLTAVIVLGATPAQMGILSATGGASVLLFSLWAGMIVDRVRRKPVMIAADVGRALLLTSVPVLALMHVLSMAHLIAVAACTGVLTVLFDVAYQSYLPSLVGPDDLFEGNRLLSISSSTAEVLGPSLTGVLVQLITAPFAILFDALSFVVSGISVWLIAKPEPAAHATPHESLRDEMLGGMETILAHPLLRALFFRSISAFLSMGLGLFSFYVLYAIRVLGLKPASLGVAIALGGAGSLIGGILSTRIARLVPLKFSFFASALLIGCLQVLTPLASSVPRFSLLLICLHQFFGDFAWTVYYVNETTLRQSVAPPHLLGRVNAAIQVASRGMLPIGALAGGFLGGRIGIVNTLWIGAAGILLSTLWLLPILRAPSTSAGRIS